MLEETAAARDGVIDAAAHQRRADWLIPAAQALGNGHHVGHHAIFFVGKESARAAHAGHHLVQQQQHAVAVAHRADAAEVISHRRHRTGRGTDHRLGDKRGDVFRTQLDNLRVQFICQALHVLPVGLAVEALAVSEARRDVMRGHQQRQEGLPAPCVAANRQRTERVAVIALATRDEELALRLADLDEVLAREFQCGLDGFRATGDEVHVIEIARCCGGQACGELLGHIRREERRVRIGQRAHLLADGLDHTRMPVAEARDGSTAAGIQIALAVGINEGHAFAADGGGQRLARVAMEDGGGGRCHGRSGSVSVGWGGRARDGR